MKNNNDDLTTPHLVNEDVKKNDGLTSPPPIHEDVKKNNNILTPLPSGYDALPSGDYAENKKTHQKKEQRKH